MEKATLRPVYIGRKKMIFPPSLNGGVRHWAVRAKITKEFKNEAWATAKEAKLKKREKANIKITYYTCYPRDRDNAYTSVKPILDGLILAGVAKDDSEEYIELKVRSVKVSHLKEQRVEVEVSDLT